MKIFFIFIIAIILVSLCVSASASPENKFGIIGAMDIEIALLKEAASITDTQTIAGMDFYSGRLGNSQVIIVKSGMGKVNAGICTQLLITKFGATHVINTGVAGSLNPSLNIGDLVIAVDCVQHDFDVTPLGFARGEIPYTKKFAFESDKDLRREVIEAAGKIAPEQNIIEGRICTGDQFISSKAQKDFIIKNFNGDCCEMESAAVAQVCCLNQIPCVIIRAISDKADSEETIDFHEFEEVTARLSASIIKSLLEGR